MEGCPEEPVEGVQFGPRSLPFEHGDLLPEGEDFEGRVAATAEEDTDHGEDGEDEFRHELTLVTRCNVARAGQRLKLQGIDFKTSRSFGYTHLIAPRPALVMAPTFDRYARLADVEREVEASKRIYRLLGQPGALSLETSVDFNRFPRRMQERVREWLGGYV